MSEQVQVTTTMQNTVDQPHVQQPTVNRSKPQVISHPRDVAAVLMAQMNMVNTKKDELTIAIKGLTDLTQQLGRAYAGQMQVIEQLANRLKALEAKGDTNGVKEQAVA